MADVSTGTGRVIAKTPLAIASSSAAGVVESVACLVVENHRLMGQLVAGLLRTLPGVGRVDLATTVAAGVAAVAQGNVDLLVLDLRLDDGDGLDVLRAAIRRRSDVVGIVLSAAAAGWRYPADLAPHLAAVVDKTADAESLRGEVERFVQRRLGTAAAPRAVDPRAVLRARELEVFERIGRGMSTRDIARSLGISVHTVNTHRKAIVDKLGVVGAQPFRIATLHNQTSHP